MNQNIHKHVCHCAAWKPRDHFIPFQKGNFHSKKKTEIDLTIRCNISWLFFYGNLDWLCLSLTLDAGWKSRLIESSIFSYTGSMMRTTVLFLLNIFFYTMSEFLGDIKINNKKIIQRDGRLFIRFFSWVSVINNNNKERTTNIQI